MEKDIDKSYLLAPKINPEELWKLDSEEFNDWRRKNDFPRIVQFCKGELNKFTEWQDEFKIKDSTLIYFGPAIFLKPNKEIFLIKYKNKKKEIKSSIVLKKPKLGLNWAQQEIITFEKIIPYLTWAKQKYISIYPEKRDYNLTVQSWSHPKNNPSNISAKILKKLELLNLGSCQIANIFLSGRNLEFLCLDNLSIKDCKSNQYLNIWFSTAKNMKINTDIAFVSFYNTVVGKIEILNSRLQDWYFEKSPVSDGEIRGSTLFKWGVYSGFNPFIIDTKLEQCNFKFKVDSYYSLKSIEENYDYIKRVYSSSGRYNEAGKYHYLEKLIHLKRLSHPFLFTESIIGDKLHEIFLNYRKGIFDKNEAKNRLLKTTLFFLKFIINPINWFKILKNLILLIFYLFEFLFWGYGEKPIRIIYSVFTIILGFSFFYYFLSASQTYHDLISSVYFSTVTFSTLGYGDIIQTGNLRLFTAIEALIGVFCMGFIIAGFTNKRRY